MRLVDLEAIADAQHGLVTRAQAREQGVSASAWDRARRTRSVVPTLRNVARLPGYPQTPEQRILAAVLSVQAGALASHRSAAYLWGLEIEGADPVDLIAPHSARRQGVLVHRPRDRLDLQPSYRRGIPTVNPLRVLADLGAVAPGRVVDALEHFVIRGHVTRRAAEAALTRHAAHGHDGITALRAALADWALDDRPPDSVLEPAMARLVRRHRLPPPVFHLRVGRFEPDFAWPRPRVIAEVDGWGKYATRADFERQAARDAALVALGWVVLHFSWRQVVTRPDEVAAQLRAVLVERAVA